MAGLGFDGNGRDVMAPNGGSGPGQKRLGGEEEGVAQRGGNGRERTVVVWPRRKCPEKTGGGGVGDQARVAASLAGNAHMGGSLATCGRGGGTILGGDGEGEGGGRDGGCHAARSHGPWRRRRSFSHQGLSREGARARVEGTWQTLLEVSPFQ